MFEWLPLDVELVTDLSPADWFSSKLEPWPRQSGGGIRLASFMPDAFDSYVRIFHPFEVWDGRTRTSRSWSDVAAERGVSIDAETDAEQVAGEDWEAIGGNHPTEGEIPEAVCAPLVQILATTTATPTTCWFALWSGWGQLNGPRILLSNPGPSRKEQRENQLQREREERSLGAIPQITLQPGTGRSYLLFRGPIEAACSFEPDHLYLSCLAG